MSDKKPMVVVENVVVKMDYTLTVDGEEVDSSKGEGPLEFLQGFQNIIPGLESELEGMKLNEAKTVIVQPADGYGELDPNAIMDVPRSEFPDTVPMDVGVELHVTDNSGDSMLATITEIGEETIKLDTNHPLAGQELKFEVKIVGIREPTEEEISHGHVHSGHHHH